MPDPPSGESALDEDWRADRALAVRLDQAWPAFFGRFGRLSAVQRAVAGHVLDGEDVLVCAPTAAGKTEAACAPLMQRFKGSRHPWTVLYISPTRALVNDLYERLTGPLTMMGLSLARRTGDHHDPLDPRPNVLLTTPESLDSMLCRERRQDGGHVLAPVCAVVLDEVHLLHATARGEQLRWLIGRLRRLREFAREMEWVREASLQIVGLSATLPDPRGVLQAYFGTGASLIEVSGSRDIEAVGFGEDARDVLEALPPYLACASDPEKTLVFCNAKKRVDALASELSTRLDPLGYTVMGHHGSLAQGSREAAETAVKAERRIVLVSTSTLEIGVDIGDIDLVVLDGPPPDMSAFLQRIGRGNRRTRKTRVMLCGSEPGDGLVLRAMLDAARAGYLGPAESGPTYAVARQQVASYIAQGPRLERREETLLELLETRLSSDEARRLMEHLIQSGDLDRVEAGVRLGTGWLEANERGDIHSVIEGQLGATVTDHASGEAIAVNIRYTGGKRMEIAGKRFEVTGRRDRNIEVRRAPGGRSEDAQWSYASSTQARGASQPQAVRRYLGFPPTVWPLVEGPDGVSAFHFGGARMKALLELMALRAGMEKAVRFGDFAMTVKSSDKQKPSWLADVGPATLEILIAQHVDRLERALARPRANKHLPLEFRTAELRGWLDVDAQLRRVREAEWQLEGSAKSVAALQALVGR